MKKAIVLLLALAVLGGAVFAQSAIKFDGYVSTGLYLTGDTVELQNYFNSGKDTRVRFNASYADGDFGMKFRLQTNDPAAAPMITQAYVRGGFFNNVLKFKVGKLDDYSMATWNNSYGSTDGMLGPEFFITPATGLTFAVFMPVTMAGAPLSDSIDGTKLGVSYAMDGVGSFLAGGDFLLATQDAWFAAQITAVENLSAKVEVYIPTFDTVEPQFSSDVGYTMDKLTVSLYDEVVFASTLTWLVEPYVSYALSDMLSVGADFTYTDAGDYDVFANVSYNPGKEEINAKVGYDGTDAYVGVSLDFYF